MESKLIGTVTQEEKMEILEIHERKLGIEELQYTLDGDLLSEEEKQVMQEKIKDEIEKNKIVSQEWWHKMAERYDWQMSEEGHWYLNFETSEVFVG